MEIRNIVSYFFIAEKNIIEVLFRTIEDSDDVVRIDQIEYPTTIEYGFELIAEKFDFYDDKDLDDFEIEDVELDEDELITFLNEYYLINPNLLPKPQLY